MIAGRAGLAHSVICAMGADHSHHRAISCTQRRKVSGLVLAEAGKQLAVDPRQDAPVRF